MGCSSRLSRQNYRGGGNGAENPAAAQQALHGFRLQLPEWVRIGQAAQVEGDASSQELAVLPNLSKVKPADIENTKRFKAYIVGYSAW